MAKELTEEEKNKIKGQSTSKVLEDFYAAQKKKTGIDPRQSILNSLQQQADAEDAAFNANLAKQRQQSEAQASSNIAPQSTQKELNPVSEQKFPSKYLTQEQVQAQNAFEENKPQFTEAGKFGKKIGEGVSSGLKYLFGDVAGEYLLEPTLNMPKTALDIFPATAEAVAGVAGVPLNLGRVPKINVPTSFDKPEAPPPEAPEKPQPLSTQEPEEKVTPALVMV